jgi:transposase
MGKFMGLADIPFGRLTIWMWCQFSNAGQSDIRRLLILGAMSRLNWLGQKSIPDGSWLAQLATRKPRMLVAVALANKMARAIWAMLTRRQDYRDPAPGVATI